MRSRSHTPIVRRFMPIIANTTTVGQGKNLSPYLPACAAVFIHAILNKSVTIRTPSHSATRS